MGNGVMMFQPGGLVYKSGAGRYAQHMFYVLYTLNSKKKIVYIRVQIFTHEKRN